MPLTSRRLYRETPPPFGNGPESMNIGLHPSSSIDSTYVTAVIPGRSAFPTASTGCALTSLVDYHQIRRFLGSLSLNDPLPDTQHTSLRAMYESFVPHWMSKQSVPQIDAAIASLRHQVVSRLAQDALDRGEIAFALTLADDLRREDQDDESAYELLNRAHLRVGKSADAIRKYRQYSDHLMNDLGVEPTFSIADLLEDVRA